MVVEAVVGQEEPHPPGPNRCPGTCRATGHITASSCRLGVGRMLCHCARGAQLRVSCLSVRVGGGGKRGSVRDGEDGLGNSKRLSPMPSLALLPAPRPALPRLAHHLTRYEQRLRAGPCLFCLCVGAGLGGVARLMGETPTHPAHPCRPRPCSSAPRPALPGLADGAVPAARQRSTWLKHGLAFLR